MKYFFDTSALMNYFYNNNNELPAPSFVISIYTIQYLEEHQLDNIICHKILNQLVAHRDKWEVATPPPFPLDCEKKLSTIYPTRNRYFYELASAINYERMDKEATDNTVFITGSLSQSIIANLLFGEDSIQFIP